MFCVWGAPWGPIFLAAGAIRARSSSSLSASTGLRVVAAPELSAAEIGVRRCGCDAGGRSVVGVACG